MTDEDTIGRIISLNEGLEKFWSQSEGWASIETSKLLTKSKFNWQSSLSRYLKIYLNDDVQQEDGALILAWTTLGALVEGTLKMFLAVYHDDYLIEEENSDNIMIKDRNGELIGQDELGLEKLKQFFALRIWTEEIRRKWAEHGEENWIEWISKVQQKRNAIHAFKDRDIGDFSELFINIGKYLTFLRKINDLLPYPDEDIYKPREK